MPNYRQLKPRLDELNAQSDYGLIDQTEWYQQVAEVTGLDEADVRAGIQSEHQRNETLLAYSQQLRSQGVLVGMLSNIGTGAMDQFFTPQERAELFDAVVLSGEEMMTKPNPAIFTLMAERLGVAPGDCVMIDDIAGNCAGADAAGMRAIQFRDSQQTISEVTLFLQ